MTQPEFGELVGVSKESIEKIENGKLEMSEDLAIRVAYHTGCMIKERGGKLEIESRFLDHRNQEVEYERHHFLEHRGKWASSRTPPQPGDLREAVKYGNEIILRAIQASGDTDLLRKFSSGLEQFLFTFGLLIPPNLISDAVKSISEIDPSVRDEVAYFAAKLPFTAGRIAVEGEDYLRNHGLCRIKALSVRQPWASLIAVGAMKLVFHHRSTSHRGPLLICAPREGRSEAGELLSRSEFKEALKPLVPANEARRDVMLKDLEFGCAVALVEVTNCVPMGEVPSETLEMEGRFESERRFWGSDAKKKYAWETHNPRRIMERLDVTARGRIFEVEVPERWLADEVPRAPDA